MKVQLTVAQDSLNTIGDPAVVGNIIAFNGIDSTLFVDSASVKSHSISNGIISFDDIDTFGAALALDSTQDVAAVVQYLQSQDFGNAGRRWRSGRRLRG